MMMIGWTLTGVRMVVLRRLILRTLVKWALSHYNANTSQHCICRLWCHVDVSIERGATSEKESLLVQSQGSKEDISGKSDQSRGS